MTFRLSVWTMPRYQPGAVIFVIALQCFPILKNFLKNKDFYRINWGPILMNLINSSRFE